MNNLKTITTSKGNIIEFLTFENMYGKDNHVLVSDTSCLKERLYVIGQPNILSWDDYDKENDNRQIVESIEQIITIWENEELHF
jgi:hypothetical protein